MNITLLKDGSLLALYRSRWANHIYQSRSNDGGQSWFAPQATELPDNNSSVQVTTPANGDLALVFNAMSAEGVSERRTSLYDEIEEHDAKVRRQNCHPSAALFSRRKLPNWWVICCHLPPPPLPGRSW